MNPKRESNGRKVGSNSPAIRHNLRVVSTVSWRDISSDTVNAMVQLVTQAGAAIMFGVTSDGGALSLCILDNQSKIKEYPRDEREVDNIYAWLRDVYFCPDGKPLEQ